MEEKNYVCKLFISKHSHRALTNATPKVPRTVPKIPKSVVVQHKVGVRMINKIGVRKIELNIICKIN